jgi:uncharacterized protein (DUF2164 family)
MRELKLDKQQKADMVSAIRTFLATELDLDIGGLQAEMLVDQLSDIVAPVFYNRGLQDAHTAVLRRMEDAAGDIDVLEKHVPRRL